MSEVEVPFKVCSMCGYVWPTVESFVLDGALRVEGYQADFEKVERGFILLTHACPGCHSTLAVPVRPFGCFTETRRDYPLRLLTSECGGHCLCLEDLSPCAANCKMRWVRDVLIMLQEHKLPDRLKVINESADTSR